MTKEQAVVYLRFSGFSDEQIKAIEGAFACELIGCLTGRPCPVCRFKTENGCYRWECVFKGGVK